MRHLSLADFRSYVTAEVTFAPGVTTLVGTNGQGKTNLVEAIGYLASLSSHRVAQDAPLVRYGAERAVARGSVMRRVGSDEREALIELEIVPGRANRARLNRNPVARPREVLGTLRTVLFAPEDLALVKGDPSERRRFLDDLLVARQPRWAGVRSDYERILKQRNALLKSASQELRRSMGTRRRPSERDRPQGLSTALPTGEASAGEVSSGVPAVLSAIDTLDVWDDHLATVGAQLLYARLRLVRDLGPLLAQAYAAVADTGAPGESGALGDGGGGGPAAGSGDGAPPATDGQGPVAAEAGAGQGASAPGDPDPHSVARISYRSSLADDDAEVLSAALAGDAVPDPSELRALLLGSLARRRTAEIERGVTLVGPHRDELVCQLGDLPAKGYASHGESWSFALGLRLAAFHLLRRDLGDDPVLVLDDVFAELDSGRRERLAALIESSEQVIITAAVPEDIPTRLRGARFRVTRGFIAAESPTEPASESEPAPMAPSVEEPPVARGDPGAGAPVLGGERGDRTQAGDEHD